MEERPETEIEEVREEGAPREGRYMRGLPENFPPLAMLFSDPSRPLEVEIGCGKGKFIVSRAAANPERNFLALDYARKWMNVGAARGEKRQLGNLRFVHTNAVILARDYLPDASVSVFHIYFPDPWPKRRHQKRRLLTASFLALLHRKLGPGGLIEAAMDRPDYFEQLLEEAAASGVSWAATRRSTNERLFSPEFKTSYELKYEAEGRPLYYAEFKK